VEDVRRVEFDIDRGMIISLLLESTTNFYFFLTLSSKVNGNKAVNSVAKTTVKKIPTAQRSDDGI